MAKGKKAKEEWENVRKKLSEETGVKSGRGQKWEEEKKRTTGRTQQIQKKRKRKHSPGEERRVEGNKYVNKKKRHEIQ